MTSNAKLAYKQMEELVERFQSLSDTERSQLNEAATCQGFILPMFKALGWDTSNPFEVSPEEKVSKGWVDYSFRIDGIPRFFLEAKRVAEDLTQEKWVTQIIDYAWTKGVTWGFLSNFEGLRVFNAEWKETHPLQAQFIEFSIGTYLSDFERLWWLSREQMIEGVLDKEAVKVGKKSPKQPVTELLFDDLKKWRHELYRHLRGWNKFYSPDQIDEAVLKIINRLIFIRTAEDRSVEGLRLLPMLRELEENNSINDLPVELSSLFREFDKTYDSDLFAPHFSEDLDCEPEPFKRTIEELYEKPGSYVRYNFNAIDADILGAAYEQYLGHVVADLEFADRAKRPQKRKEEGIYYTPSFVVRFIVKWTVTRILRDGKIYDPNEIHVLDMACGSGSFLLEAFDAIDRHISNNDGANLTVNDETEFDRQINILQNSIYGVDRDKQAVEVARLNLMIKALHFKQELPMLENIRTGDSLVSGSKDELIDTFEDDWKTIEVFRWEDEFSDVIKGNGFDSAIGNPPYFNVETLGKQSAYIDWIKSHFEEVWMDKSDILFYFISRGIELLKPGGRLGFIVSRAFLQADKASNLRGFIANNCVLESILDYRDLKIFQDADIATAIIILRKVSDEKKRTGNIIQIANVLNKDLDGEEISQIIDSHMTKNEDVFTDDYEVFKYPQSRLGFEPWYFVSSDISDLYAEIDSDHPILGDLCHVGEGMQTGANKVFEVSEDTIYQYELEEDWLWKRVPNSDIGQYVIHHSGKWLIWVEDTEHFSDCPKNIAKYLKKNREKLESRAAFIRGNCEWYKFTWPLHKEHYEKSKIIVPYRASFNRFALDEEAEYLGLTDTTVIFREDDDPHNLRYYLALLNSNLLTFRFKGIGKMTGNGMYEYFENSVRRLPIRVIDFTDPQDKKVHDNLVKLVERLMDVIPEYEHAEKMKYSNRHSLRRKIDRMWHAIDGTVCNLYGISKESMRDILKTMT